MPGLKRIDEFKHVALRMNDEQEFVAKAKYRDDLLAIHATPTNRAVTRPGWIVTHIRSGKAIISRIKSLQLARTIRDELSAVPGWHKREKEIMADTKMKQWVQYVIMCNKGD